MKYKLIWDTFFQGGDTMWNAYGYDYHSYKIVDNIVYALDIPDGDIIQFGCGLGVTVEKLCSLFGKQRVYGYDILNPLNHPNIYQYDSELDDIPEHSLIAYCDIDIGSLTIHKELREELFSYAWDNLAVGGYILVNNSIVDKFRSNHSIASDNMTVTRLDHFDVKELYKDPIDSRVFTKSLVSRNK